MSSFTAWFRQLFNAPPIFPEKGTSKPVENADLGVRVTLAELLALQAQAPGVDHRFGRRSARQIAGSFHSGFRGRGMNYVEDRPYQLGDDLRHINWKVTARTGNAYTKLFEEEKECPVFIVLDYPDSLFFGSQSCFKSVQAARIAALIAWKTVLQKDRVGGLLFSSQHHLELKPKIGQRGLLPLLQGLVDFTNVSREAVGSNSQLENGLNRLRHLTHHGSRIILISDYQAYTPEMKTALLPLTHRNEIIAIQVYDPLEAALPPPGCYALSDGEKIMALDTHDERLRQAYAEQFVQQRHDLAAQLQRCGIPLFSVSTEDGLPDALRRAPISLSEVTHG